jgi:diguanylate cyclase (GGDEF)-like protein/PAS domain S-box-containing protein
MHMARSPAGTCWDEGCVTTSAYANGGTDDPRLRDALGTAEHPDIADDTAARVLLADVVRRVSASLHLPSTLDAVAHAVVDSLGFGVAAINLVQDDGDLVVATVAGPADVQELLGARRARDLWDVLMGAAEPWGELRFLRHDNPAQNTPGLLTWTPDFQVGDADDAWHPEDALFAPLWAVDGTLVGVLSVDLPVHGRRPGPRQRELLEQFARQAALAIDHARIYSRMSQSEQLFRAVFDQSPVAIALLDTDGALTRFNPSYAHLVGDQTGDLIGRCQDEWICADDRAAYRDALLEARSGQAPQPIELRFLAAQTRPVWGRLSLVALTNDADSRVLTQVENIDSRKQLELELAHAAMHDALTGLPNRLLLMDRVGQALTRSRRAGEHVAVLYCDLDHFKSVNDTYGHATGDELIQATARRLTSSLREQDTAGRIGGDEFIVVVGQLSDPADAAVLAQRILTSVAQPIDIGGLRLTTTASIGVAISAPGAPSDPDDLLSRADHALYQAKRSGRNRWLLASDG